jgi:hypothetical protein
MGDNREGGGANWTPAEAQKSLALPVMYIFLRKAIPIFPGTSRASVSRLVQIRPTVRHDEFLPGLKCGFPTTVNWKQWGTAVVPVLKDPRFETSKPIIRDMIERNPREYAALIGEALALSFHEAGYGPLPL